MKNEDHWMKAIFRSYTQCRFVEDEGDVILYASGSLSLSR